MSGAFTGLAAVLALASQAPGAGDGVVNVALVVGVNRSVDADLEVLRYADDDAARYAELLEVAGVATVVLADVDADTRRVHPEVASRARPPRADALAAALAELAAQVAAARRDGRTTAFYFVYAGHGNRDREAYLTLEDRRISGTQLHREVVEAVGADRSHLIIDACYSYYLAHGRGPGGHAVAASGFSQGALARDPRVGLLLSTSSAAESHEWEAFQAGVFSHEIRSGLYGAADVDADGRVSYREIAAFVATANEAVPNERFRPRVFAKAPDDSGVLLRLRGAGQLLRVDGAHHGHHYVEDVRGVRLLDFHNGAAQPLLLRLPAAHPPLYLRPVGRQLEYQLPADAAEVEIAALQPSQPRAGERGAAHHAFQKLFDQPFDAGAVARFRLGATPAAADALEIVGQPDPPGWAGAAGLGLALAGGGAVLLGCGATGVAAWSYLTLGPEASQREAAERNQGIATANAAALWLFGAGAVAALGGAALLWQPWEATAPAPEDGVDRGE